MNEADGIHDPSYRKGQNDTLEWLREKLGEPNLPTLTACGKRIADLRARLAEADAAVEWCLPLLRNLTLEHTGWRRWFSRWVIPHEPLRSDAVNVLKHNRKAIGRVEENRRRRCQD